MVNTTYSWEEETRRYISDIRTELNETKKQFEEYKFKQENLQRELDSWDFILQSYLKRTGKQVTLKQDLKIILDQQKNHRDRIKIIAEQNNGLVKVGFVADILYTNGLIKSKSRMAAYRIVYGLMLRMVEDEIFEKARAGEFRLIGSQPRLPANI